MATNFKISIRREKNGLHLKLNGLFDGSSAYELIHLLQKLARSRDKVYIHTSRLKQIYPFGRNIFRNNLHLFGGQGISIVFTGENAREMLPQLTDKFEKMGAQMVTEVLV